jgi:hypothetical protein
MKRSFRFFLRSTFSSSSSYSSWALASLVALVASPLITACSATPVDGTLDSTSAEAWDPSNAPGRVANDFEYSFSKLPTAGASKKAAWSETYWPQRDDSFNTRWNGVGELSPLEKYDAAFNGWVPSPEFRTLRPLTTSSCRNDQWDRSYYDQLGPAASYWTYFYGNGQARGRARPGNACSALTSIADWAGSCHAWTPAAILEEEPEGPVEVNGVRFETSDVRALVTMLYSLTNGVVLGERCSEGNLSRDANGRINDPWCRDVSAGTFHVLLSNMLGIRGQAIGEDRVGSDEVWNQPVVGYTVTANREVPQEEALSLLRVAPGTIYPWNSAAKRFVYVATTVDYVSERQPSKDVSIPNISLWTKTDPYSYILELDDAGSIVGGEWLPGVEPPDYLWKVVSPGRMANPNASRWEIRKLLRASRPSSADGRARLYENVTSKPLADFGTVTSTLRIDEEPTSRNVKVLIDIAHSNAADLTVTLEKDGKVVAKLFDRNHDAFGFEDLAMTYDVDLSVLPSAVGDYTLRVRDSVFRSYGTLNAWGVLAPR